MLYLRFDLGQKLEAVLRRFGAVLVGITVQDRHRDLAGGVVAGFLVATRKVVLETGCVAFDSVLCGGVGAGLFTAWVEWAFVGAKGSEFNFTFIERTIIAGRAIWFYLGKLIWPVDLIFMYPRWHVSQVVWWQYLFPAMALLVTLGLWLLSRRNREPLAALAFFVGTVFPALGFFNAYPFRYSFVADHFQYLAMIGPLTLAAAGIDKLFRRLRDGREFWEPKFCGTLLLVLGGLTWYQCGIYADGETLWRATLARNPDCWTACNNLGFILTRKGEVGEAMAHSNRPVNQSPRPALLEQRRQCTVPLGQGE